MLFESRYHWLPKDVGSESEYEDAFGVDAEAGRLAVADGVSSGFRSRSWAQLLTSAVLKAPPDPTDADAVAHWLARPRSDWAGAFDPDKLPWMQRGKYQACGGGYSTLQWVELTPDNHQADMVHYLSAAVGDCCLFHIRDRALLRSFPMKNAADFDLDPASLFSHQSSRDATTEFVIERGVCKDGDVLMLATDALAQWLLRREESGIANDWSELWELTQESWASLIDRLRHDGEIRVDDTTLLMAKIGAYQPSTAPAYDLACLGPPAVEACTSAPIPIEVQNGEHAIIVPLADHEPTASLALSSDADPSDSALPSAVDERLLPCPPPTLIEVPATDGVRTPGWLSFFRGSVG